jgi:hypothetical protein
LLLRLSSSFESTDLAITHNVCISPRASAFDERSSSVVLVDLICTSTSDPTFSDELGTRASSPAEIAAVDEAEAAQKAWEAYTERWRRVLASRDRANVPRWTWADVPWPTRVETDVWIRKEEEAKRRARNVRGSNWASPALAWWASFTGLESLADDAMRDFLFPALTSNL